MIYVLPMKPLAYIIPDSILKIKRHLTHEKMCVKCLLTKRKISDYYVGVATIIFLERMYFHEKLFASLLAALMLCTGLSQFAFAAEPTDPNNQPPTEESQEGSQPKPSPLDFINGPKGDGN